MVADLLKAAEIFILGDISAQRRQVEMLPFREPSVPRDAFKCPKIEEGKIKVFIGVETRLKSLAGFVRKEPGKVIPFGQEFFHLLKCRGNFRQFMAADNGRWVFQ